MKTTADALISAHAQKLEKDYKEGAISPSLWEQYNMQLRHLRDETRPDVEFVITPMLLPYYPREPGKAYLTIIGALNHPFSRGTIHVKSTDPQVQPAIDPGYFSQEFDMQILVEQAKFIRRLVDTEPFKSYIDTEVVPGSDVRTDDGLREYIKKGLNTIWHTCGSCSMLPREKGGVVDEQLKVYGTTNVRVVDLSIVPLHFATHPQAPVYAIANQAADIIMGLA